MARRTGSPVDLTGDEAHGDTGDGGPSRTPRLQQRQGGGADRAHRGGAVGAHGLGELADRVGELLARRQHGQQGAARERAVTDLATLRRTDATRLAGGERREDVLVHVTARLLRGERVELLLQREHVERADPQDLGLAALEQGGAVDARITPTSACSGRMSARPGSMMPSRRRARGRGSCSAPERGADLLLAALELAERFSSRAPLISSDLELALQLRRWSSRRPCRPSLRLDGGVTSSSKSRKPGTPGAAWRPPWPAAWASTSCLMNGLAASRPPATISSVGACTTLDQVQGLLGGLGLDHLIATSPLSVTTRTTMSNTAFSSWLCDGKATHWPSMSATRTPPTGPENGRPESCVDSDAALIAGRRTARRGLTPGR